MKHGNPMPRWVASSSIPYYKTSSTVSPIFVLRRTGVLGSILLKYTVTNHVLSCNQSIIS